MRCINKLPTSTYDVALFIPQVQVSHNIRMTLPTIEIVKIIASDAYVADRSVINEALDIIASTPGFIRSVDRTLPLIES